MTRGPRASPVINIGYLARGALPDQRRASDRHPSEHPGASAREFCPERPAAAARAR